MEEFLVQVEEDNRKRKQDYLRKNIIEAGYKAEEFGEFITAQKHEGENIDNWTFDELETMVALFKKTSINQSFEE